MSEFSYHFQNLFGALADKQIDIDAVIAIAKENEREAAFILKQRLGASSVTPMDPTELWYAMEILWHLEGPETCVLYSFPLSQPEHIVAQFLGRKLMHEADTISEAALEQILRTWRKDPTIYQIVPDVKAKRAVNFVLKKLSNPRELNEDVGKVKKQVTDFGFGKELNELLDKVEKGLGVGDGFDQKALLTHLRTFFEKAHERAGEKLQAAKPTTKNNTDLTKCGKAIEFLCEKDVLTNKMMQLAKGLYAVLSNEGVHAITSEKEYVRLCRNMVTEYALVLFFELERRLKE